MGFVTIKDADGIERLVHTSALQPTPGPWHAPKIIYTCNSCDELRSKLADSERTVAELRAQRQEFSQRLHLTAQILVEEFGANGPSNADELARRAVAIAIELRERAEAAEAELARVRSA